MPQRDKCMKPSEIFEKPSQDNEGNSNKQSTELCPMLFRLQQYKYHLKKGY